jgi:hypothetical protein
MQHSERKHAKLSASGAERWTQCPGSVKLSEGIPDRDSPWSLEGTRAHEVLENVLRGVIQNSKSTPDRHSGIPREMLQHVLNTARFVFSIHTQHPHSELLVEDRISLDFIHPDMWGTFDAAVVDHFGILHVFDFKYGAGHPVSPEQNLQAIFYGLGLAHAYDYNFEKIRLWIIQPRIPNYQGPAFWDLSVHRLRSYIRVFAEAVRAIEQPDPALREGPHCFFCKAKAICPLKRQSKMAQGKLIFKPVKE